MKGKMLMKVAEMSFLSSDDRLVPVLTVLWALHFSSFFKQWRSRTFGRLVRWSNLPPYCLRLGK